MIQLEGKFGRGRGEKTTSAAEPGGKSPSVGPAALHPAQPREGPTLPPKKEAWRDPGPPLPEAAGSPWGSLCCSLRESHLPSRQAGSHPPKHTPCHPPPPTHTTTQHTPEEAPGGRSLVRSEPFLCPHPCHCSLPRGLGPGHTGLSGREGRSPTKPVRGGET